MPLERMSPGVEVFYYYGAKHRLARYYPAPAYPVIVEPFAGAAGYSMFHLERDSSLHAILVEKDPRVAELWRRLLAMSPDDIANYPLPKAGEFSTDFFVMAAAASNALASCRGFTVTPRVQREFVRMRARVARVCRAVAGRVFVVSGDYTEADTDEAATWFVDPPYRPRRSTARTANPGGMGYAKGCDSASIDYPALAEWCATRPGQVIVAEYADAEWLPFRPLRAHQRSDGAQYREGIWTSESEPHALDCDMGRYCRCGAAA